MHIYLLINSRGLFELLPAMAAKKMRWCTVSDPEQRKCAELAKALVAVLPPAAVAAFARLSCIRASSTTDCIDRIRVSQPSTLNVMNLAKRCAKGRENNSHMKLCVYYSFNSYNKPFSSQIHRENPLMPRWIS